MSCNLFGILGISELDYYRTYICKQQCFKAKCLQVPYGDIWSQFAVLCGIGFRALNVHIYLNLFKKNYSFPISPVGDKSDHISLISKKELNLALYFPLTYYIFMVSILSNNFSFGSILSKHTYSCFLTFYLFICHISLKASTYTYSGV